MGASGALSAVQQLAAAQGFGGGQQSQALLGVPGAAGGGEVVRGGIGAVAIDGLQVDQRHPEAVVRRRLKREKGEEDRQHATSTFR